MARLSNFTRELSNLCVKLCNFTFRYVSFFITKKDNKRGTAFARGLIDVGWFAYHFSEFFRQANKRVSDV